MHFILNQEDVGKVCVGKNVHKLDVTQKTKAISRCTEACIFEGHRPFSLNGLAPSCCTLQSSLSQSFFSGRNQQNKFLIYRLLFLPVIKSYS